VESEKEFSSSVESLFASGYASKSIAAASNSFFEIVPSQFDIVYFDACGTVAESEGAHALMC